MMKFFKTYFPCMLVVVILFNTIAAYGAGNDMAVWANITALCGWIIIAIDEIDAAKKVS